MNVKGLTEYRLAQLTGVPQPTIHRIVKGVSRDPKNATLDKLAAHFGISVEELRGEAVDPKGRTGRFQALSEEALELLAAFERLPPERQQAYKDFLYMEVFALDQMPWLKRGRPVKESYSDYERRMTALGHAAHAREAKKS